jgi:ABC-type branched-subunit amino acid transport system substrate-binding protein
MILTVVALVAAVSGIAHASSPQRRGGGTTRGITDTSIKVGGLGQAAFFQDSAVGAQARFKRANDNNELPGGRKIDFVGFRDDNSDPNQDLSEGKKLVQEDQVFAVVPTITPALGASNFFAQNKVPFFGWGIAAGFCDNPFGFGFSGCLTPPDPKIASSAWGDLIKAFFKGDVKAKTAAVIAEDNDSGKAGVRVIAASAKAGGFKVVYAKNPVPPPPAQAPDYTPFANDILRSNNGKPPDVVFVVTSFPRVAGLQGKLTELGYTGVLTNAVGYDPRLASQYKGSTVFIQFNAYESAKQGNSAMQQIIDEIHAVKPDALLTQGVLSGYLSADIFVKAVKKAGKSLTVEKFLKAANSNFKWSLKGVMGQITYPAGHTHQAPCGTLVESDGANYTINVPFKCYREIKVK